MFKKIVFLVAVVLTALSGAACSSPEGGDATINMITGPSATPTSPTIPTPTMSISWGSVKVYKGNPDCTTLGCEPVILIKDTSCGDNQITVPANSNIHTRMFLYHGQVYGRELVIDSSVSGVSDPSYTVPEAGNGSPFIVKPAGFNSKTAGNSWQPKVIVNERVTGGASLGSQSCVVTARVS